VVRICMYIPSFFPLVGGAERQAQSLSQALVRKGHQVFVLTRRIRGTESRSEVDGVPVFRVFARGPRLGFPCASLAFLVGQRRRYEIIHVHTLDSPAILACIAKRLLARPVVVKLRGADKTKRYTKTWAGRRIWRFLRRNVDCFVAVNQAIKNELISAGVDRERIRLIPNGVDTTVFVPVNEEEKAALRGRLALPEEGIAIFTGRLIQGKGLRVLLEAWAAVHPRLPGARLLLAGSGPERARLEAVATSLGIRGTISFLGECPHDRIREYLQASDVFVMPSRAEGISNAILEAMATGLAVAATRISGITDLIDEGKNGLLFDVDDKGQLATLLVRLLGNSEHRRRLGRAARATVTHSFSIDGIAEQYETVYTTLAQRSI